MDQYLNDLLNLDVNVTRQDLWSSGDGDTLVGEVESKHLEYSLLMFCCKNWNSVILNFISHFLI